MKKALGWASTEKQWPMAANVTISGRYIKKRVEAWWKNWVSKNIAIALREPDRSTSHIHLRSSEIACPREGRLQSRIAAPKQRDSLSLWREAQHNSWGQPMPNRCLTDANQAYKLLMSRAENEKKKSKTENVHGKDNTFGNLKHIVKDVLRLPQAKAFCAFCPWHCSRSEQITLSW